MMNSLWRHMLVTHSSKAIHGGVTAQLLPPLDQEKTALPIMTTISVLTCSNLVGI